MAFGTLGAMGRGFGTLGGLGGAIAPLPYGSKIAAMGDSIVDRNHDPQGSSTGEMSTNMRGALAQALLRDRRFDFYSVYDTGASPVYNNRSGCNWGKSGQTTSQMVSRITEISAMSPLPAVAYFRCGVNDILNTTDDAETIMARITSMISTCQSAGINYFILNTIGAVANSSEGLTYGVTSAQQTRLLALNVLIRNYCAANPNVKLCDAYQAYAQGDGYANVALLQDGLHPTSVGTYGEVVGYLLPAIRSLIRPGLYLPDRSSNLFPFDFSTTGGTVSNGVMGTAPTGMFIGRTAGTGSTTGVASKIVEGGVNKYQIALTPGGAANETFRLGFGTSGATFQSIAMASGWARLGFYVEAPTDYPIPILNAIFYRDNTTSILSYGGKGQAGATGAAFNGGNRWIVTEAIPIVGPTASLLARLDIGIQGNVAGSPVVKISEPFIVQVPDPRLH